MRLPEALPSTPQPLRHPQPCVPCGRRPSAQPKASPVEKDAGGTIFASWRMRSASWLDRRTRWLRCSTSWATRIARGGCSVPGGRTQGAPSCQHLAPAVARATAGRFVRCEWLVGRVVRVPKSPASGFCVSCSPHGWPSVVLCRGVSLSALCLTVTHCGVWGVGRVWVSRATGSWQSADATLHSHCRLLIVVIHHSTDNARDPQRGLSRATNKSRSLSVL